MERRHEGLVAQDSGARWLGRCEDDDRIWKLETVERQWCGTAVQDSGGRHWYKIAVGGSGITDGSTRQK